MEMGKRYTSNSYSYDEKGLNFSDHRKTNKCHGAQFVEKIKKKINSTQFWKIHGETVFSCAVGMSKLFQPFWGPLGRKSTHEMCFNLNPEILL